MSPGVMCLNNCKCLCQLDFISLIKEKNEWRKTWFKFDTKQIRNTNDSSKLNPESNGFECLNEPISNCSNKAACIQW